MNGDARNHKREDYIEQVQSYRYLGSTVNSDNSIEKEIQYRKHLEIEYIVLTNVSSKAEWSQKTKIGTVLEYHKTDSNISL
jgi:hypothetical protein